MARKIRTPKDSPPFFAGLVARYSNLSVDTRARVLRWSLSGVIGAAVIACTAFGFGRLEHYVHGMEQYDKPLRLAWVDLPDWLRLPENRHVLDSLVRQVNLRPQDRMLDPLLARRLGESLSLPSVGWVKSVQQIAVRPDGTVAIRCQYRKPAGWVKHGRFCYLVDEDRVRLPGTYDPADCDDGALLTVSGVALAPPPIGQLWAGDDVEAGVHLATMLEGKPFRHQVRSIVVSNIDGRKNRSRAHIELVTDRKGSRIWWGRAPLTENGTEITAAQKMTLLDTLYRQWGRIDMNRPYVNIMNWPDRVSLPTSVSAQANPYRIRG